MPDSELNVVRSSAVDLAGAAAAARLLAGIVYKTSVREPTTYAGVAVVLVAAAALASYRPPPRAAAEDPAAALRGE